MTESTEKQQPDKPWKDLSRKEKIIRVLVTIALTSVFVSLFIHSAPELWRSLTADDLPREKEIIRTILFVVLGGFTALLAFCGILLFFIWFFLSDNKIVSAIRWIFWIVLGLWTFSILVENEGWGAALSGVTVLLTVKIYFILKVIDMRLTRIENGTLRSRADWEDVSD